MCRDGGTLGCPQWSEGSIAAARVGQAVVEEEAALLQGGAAAVVTRRGPGLWGPETPTDRPSHGNTDRRPNTGDQKGGQMGRNIRMRRGSEGEEASWEKVTGCR